MEKSNDLEKANIEKMRKIDSIMSIILFLGALFFVIEALKMPVAEITGSVEKWYVSPGIFPAIIGLGIIVQSIFLYGSTLKGSSRFKKEDFHKVLLYFKTDQFKRLLIAASLLAIYIFILLGRVRYELSTFVYLFANMLIYRNGKTRIYILLIICAITAVGLGYGFSNLAKVPLP